MTDLEEVLRERFGFSEFRPGQREAIEALLANRRLLCIQPTGYGKSLLYQLPAVLLDGVTLVISPLLALVRDQVRHLRERFHVPAGSINSDQDEAENEAALAAARAGDLKVLFVAPERLDNLAHYQALLALRVRLLVVDEAHCISTWGHDFRPSYRQIIGAVRAFEARFPDLHVLGLTATADRRCEADIVSQLAGGGEARVMRANMDRPNLALGTLATKGMASKLATLDALLTGTEGCGILYCATRDHTEQVASYLEHRGHRVVAYHAGLEPERKRSLQRAFIDGTYTAVAATNALGMGIDKADLRFVVHVDVPGSITACYQEVGRAGRDGHPARGLLLFDADDARIQRHFIRSAQPTRRDFDTVMAAIHRDGEGMWPNQTQVRMRAGQHPTRTTVVLAELREQGLVDKQLVSRRQVYVRTGATHAPDLGRYERQGQVRARELESMLRYGAGDVPCLMAALRNALGDVEPSPCGRCSRCAPEAWRVRSDAHDALVAEAEAWIANQEVFIRAVRRPRISRGSALFASEDRLPGFVDFMRRRRGGALDRQLAERLVERAAALGRRHPIGGVVAMPSRTWAGRDEAVDRVARGLGVPRLDLLAWASPPEHRQGELRNTEQRKRNVAGLMRVTGPLPSAAALLLLDDYTGSGHTLREAAGALRRAGFEGDLVPLTVARVRWRLGATGIV